MYVSLRSPIKSSRARVFRGRWLCWFLGLSRVFERSIALGGCFPPPPTPTPTLASRPLLTPTTPTLTLPPPAPPTLPRIPYPPARLTQPRSFPRCCCFFYLVLRTIFTDQPDARRELEALHREKAALTTEILQVLGLR